MIRYYIFSGLNNEQSTDVDTRIQNVVHVNHRMRDAEKRKEKSRFPQIIYYLFFSCFVFLPLFAATKKSVHRIDCEQVMRQNKSFVMR